MLPRRDPWHAVLTAGASRRPLAGTLAGALALGAWCLLLHGSALQAGWRFDDPALLSFASQHSLPDYFVRPEVMRQLSYANLTPWLALFFDLNLHWFGVEPAGHYGQALVVLWATSVATGRLMSRWLPPLAAWGTGALFLAMPPTASIAQTLMTGHYAWGLLFSVLAVGAFVHAVEQGLRAWSYVAAALFALACACKELYVPLPLALLALPLGPWRRRLTMAWPLLALWPAYLALRWQVLGNLGGYGQMSHGSGLSAATLAPLLSAALLRLVHAVFGPGGWGWCAALGGAAFLLAARQFGCEQGSTRGSRVATVWAWLAVAVALLLAPMPGLMQASFPYGYERLAYAIGWVLAVAIGWHLPAALQAGRRPMLGLATSLVALLVLAQVHLTQRIEANSRIGQAQYRFLASADDTQLLLPHRYELTGYAELMAQAVTRITGRRTATVLADEEALAALGNTRGRTAWLWHEGCACLQPLGMRYDDRVADFERRMKAGAGRPLAAELSLQDRGHGKVFRWQVQGEPGELVLETRHLGALALPREGRIAFGVDGTLPLGDPIHLRVSVTCADGALIRSPLLALPASGPSSVQWRSVPPAATPEPGCQAGPGRSGASPACLAATKP